MFAIHFLSPEPEQHSEGWPALRGELQLGTDREGFRAPLGPWTAGDYEWQWRAAAKRLLAGKPAGFWTVPWQFWWVAWPEGDEAVFHEELLLPERLAAHGYTAAPPVGSAPHELIEPRESHTEDGTSVSEWRVPLNAVQTWLAEQTPIPGVT